MISTCARALRATLVVMATHGRTGLARVLLGSTAEGVLRQGRAPLVLVRPQTLPATSTSPESTLVAAARATAAELASQPAVCVRADATLEEAARLMASQQAKALVVVDADGRVLGVLAESYLAGTEHWLPYAAARSAPELRRWIPEATLAAVAAEARRLAAGDLARPTPAVSAETTAAELARLFGKERADYLPVVRDGRVIALVSPFDLVRVLSARSTAPGDHG